MEGIPISSISSICFFMVLFNVNNSIRSICIFSPLRKVAEWELSHWCSAKLLTMSCDRRGWTTTSFCSSLSEETCGNISDRILRRNNRSITNQSMCQRWQLLQAVKRAWTQLWSRRCEGDDTFVAFQPKGIFRFWNGKFPFLPKMSRENHSFPEMSTAPLFFSVPTSYFVKSPIIRWVPVLLKFYPHVQWSNENTKK